MDWSNEDYVRVYTRETTDDLELSWEALALWRTLLTKFDRSGLMPLRNGWASVSKAIRWPQEVVERVGPELIADGRLRMVEAGIFAPNFTDAQTASKSDRLRQRELRDKRREAARASKDVVAATECHAPSRDVASESRAVASTSQDVTPSHSRLAVADPSLADRKPTPGDRDTRARERHPQCGAVARAVWQYGATEHARAKASGLDPTAKPWPVMQDANDLGWGYLLDRCEEMLATKSPDEAIAVGKGRIDVAIADARKRGSLIYCAAVFAFKRESWAIGTALTPEQVANQARAGPRSTGDPKTGRVEPEPSGSYPSGKQDM